MYAQTRHFLGHKCRQNFCEISIQHYININPPIHTQTLHTAYRPRAIQISNSMHTMGQREDRPKYMNAPH